MLLDVLILADNAKFEIIVYTITIATLSSGRTVGLDLSDKFAPLSDLDLFA